MSARAESRSEDGFTLIEVVMAAALAIITVLAIGGTLSKSVFNSLGHQRQAATLAIAQREVEQIRQTVATYGFDALAMSAQPGSPSAGALATNPGNPDDFVTGSGSTRTFKIMENFHDTSGGVAIGTPSAGEQLIVGGTSSYPTAGRVTPVSTNVTSGSVTATVHRYVTQRIEACATAGSCDGDSRRVVIAVVPTDNATTELQTRKPFYFTAVINNPVPLDAQSQSGAGLRIGVNIG
jgi:type II secretory pathway pseudopilin PulG